MSADNDDIFDDNFDDFEEGGAGASAGKGNKGAGDVKNSLLDVWNSNPLVKLAVIAGLVVIGIGSVYAFVGSREKDPAASRLASAPDQREAPGSQVSENYGDALEEQNQQKLEQALGNRNVSAIPVPVNRGDTGLAVDGTEDTNTEDPLAIWQRENRVEQEQTPQVIPEPTIPPPPPQPVQVPEQQVQDLSQGIAQQIQSILESRVVKPGQYQAFAVPAIASNGLGNNNDPTPETGPKTGFGDNNGAGDGDSGFEEILVPAGSILYGQILNEANSDTPGPIVAQVLSGPFSGSRMIGKFDTQNEKIIISFDTAVINGVGTSVDAVAIDPATTSPGLATDVDKRYFRRVFLPAAARFVEGLGQAYSDQETQVFTSGDVIVSQEEKLDTKEQFARGIERGASKAGDVLDQEADRLEPLIRVEAGTPVGLVLVDPIIKPRDRARFNPAAALEPTNLEGQF